jgi:diguanylate cyclase (GGDEF)-like protein
MISFHTQRDVIRRTLIRSTIAIITAAVLALLLSFALFGTDPSKGVSAGYATAVLIAASVIVSGMIGSALTYNSARSLQKLALIRAELWRVSRTDQLTGLLNRRGFTEAAACALERAKQENTPTAALMCDVDRFKMINDRFGHQFGDAVLVEIGGILRAHAKDKGMIVGRHGGEEFAVLLLGTDADEAMQAAGAVREACAAKEVLHGGISTQVTISIGLAPSQPGPTLEAMLRDADRALYKAKESGRNRVVLAELSSEAIAPPIAPEGQHPIVWVAKLRDIPNQEALIPPGR